MATEIRITRGISTSPVPWDERYNGVERTAFVALRDERGEITQLGEIDDIYESSKTYEEIKASVASLAVKAFEMAYSREKAIKLKE